MNFILGSLIYMFSNQERNGVRQYPLNEIQSTTDQLSPNRIQYISSLQMDHVEQGLAVPLHRWYSGALSMHRQILIQAQTQTSPHCKTPQGSRHR